MSSLDLRQRPPYQVGAAQPPFSRWRALVPPRATLPMVALALVALVGGVALARLSPLSLALVLVAATLVNVLVLRRDELSAATIAVVAVLIDWYELVGAPLREPVVATLLAVVLFSLLFMTQSHERPWVAPPYLWLWGALLVLAALPVLHGVTLTQSIVYYLGIFANAFLMSVIGAQVARDPAQLRRLLALLSAFGTLVAVHSIILERTGVFLLATPTITTYLDNENNFRLAGSTAIRAGSFLQNPDWNGAFLALMVFLAVGLCVASRSRRARALYAGETLLLVVGVSITYSLASLASVGIGIVLAVLLLLRGRARVALLGALGAILLVAAVVVPTKLHLLAAHASAPRELSLRLGAWLTALNVIRAHPLTGVGLGISSYLVRAEPYRVASQYRALAHPHNSYLEVAALAGVPVFLAFVALQVALLLRAMRTFRRADVRVRPLLGGGIVAVVVLSINSLGVNAWTITPLAVIGWLLLGALASPALARAVAPGVSVQAITAAPLETPAASAPPGWAWPTVSTPARDEEVRR